MPYIKAACHLLVQLFNPKAVVCSGKVIRLSRPRLLFDLASQAITIMQQRVNDGTHVQEVVSADSQEEVCAWFQQALGVRCCLIRQCPGSRKPITPLQLGQQNDQHPKGHIGDLLPLCNKVIAHRTVSVCLRPFPTAAITLFIVSSVGREDKMSSWFPSSPTFPSAQVYLRGGGMGGDAAYVTRPKKSFPPKIGACPLLM